MNNFSYKDFLNELDDTYSVGVHGVVGLKNHIKCADNILKYGLMLSNTGGMIQNLQMYGPKGNMGSFLLDKLSNYTYIADFGKDIVNIIVAIPDVLVDGDDIYFLGHFNYSENPSISEQSGIGLPVNILTDIEKIIPKEFIYGYTFRSFFSKDDEIGFKLNPKFIDFMDKDKREEFIHKYVTKLCNKCGLHSIEQEKYIIELKRNNGIFQENEYYRQLLEYLHKEKVKELNK